MWLGGQNVRESVRMFSSDGINWLKRQRQGTISSDIFCHFWGPLNWGKMKWSWYKVCYSIHLTHTVVTTNLRDVIVMWNMCLNCTFYITFDWQQKLASFLSEPLLYTLWARCCYSVRIKCFISLQAHLSSSSSVFVIALAITTQSVLLWILFSLITVLFWYDYVIYESFLEKSSAFLYIITENNRNKVL